LSEYEGLSWPANRPLPKDKDGDILITDSKARLLAFIGQQDDWGDNPSFRGHTLDCYLSACLRAIYHAPDHMVALVHAELQDEEDREQACRRYKPHPVELAKMCVTVMEIRPALRALGMDVDPLDEPVLRPARRRKPRVILDD
jgi:hypothetical protein